jgi:hypothetical protein
MLSAVITEVKVEMTEDVAVCFPIPKVDSAGTVSTAISKQDGLLGIY